MSQKEVKSLAQASVMEMAAWLEERLSYQERLNLTEMVHKGEAAMQSPIESIKSQASIMVRERTLQNDGYDPASVGEGGELPKSDAEMEDTKPLGAIAMVFPNTEGTKWYSQKMATVMGQFPQM